MASPGREPSAQAARLPPSQPCPARPACLHAYAARARPLVPACRPAHRAARQRPRSLPSCAPQRPACAPAPSSLHTRLRPRLRLLRAPAPLHARLCRRYSDYIVAWLGTVLQYSPALPLLHSCNTIFVLQYKSLYFQLSLQYNLTIHFSLGCNTIFSCNILGQ